eukprot:CAMPEP_0172593852 /NCGR_PEP_ID=MMETSP1068-20121228/13104_1 /TAXON_ID=35684 /ORGANISM="Pseudopedinella elastica, Strain CCMP716" /LENGTH=799 /DNA_ID=CAMNT_0013391549 /DNA_START=85 /DNA_END=2484 /DNA_ORIENTATION=-
MAASKDPLDEIGDDPEVLRQEKEAYKQTLILKVDPNKGVEDNEQNFQKTMENFCEYLRPEMEKALQKETERQAEKDEDEKLALRWVPPDDFGAQGDFRTVHISYSYERERLGMKIGVPGHPAPALERWRERKAVEARAQDWTEQQMSLDQVLAQEYDTVEEEEEAIIKCLAIKYQEIDKKNSEIVNANADDNPRARAMALARTRHRPLLGAVVGPQHSMWSILTHKFPRADLFMPPKVEQGDTVVPQIRGTDVFAWQRGRTRRAETMKSMERQIAAAENPGGVHPHVLRLQKEDVDRCHEFIQKVLAGLDPDASGEQVASKGKAKKEAKARAKAAKQKAAAKGTRIDSKDRPRPDSEAGIALAKASAEARVRKAEKKRRLEAKEAKRAVRAGQEAARLRDEAEAEVRIKAEKEAEAERLRKASWFKLPSLFRSKKGGGDSDSDEDSSDDETGGQKSKEEVAAGEAKEKTDSFKAGLHKSKIKNPAQWAKAYRAQYPELIPKGKEADVEAWMNEAKESTETYASRLERKRSELREAVTEEPAKFLVQADFVRKASEGDLEGVCLCFLQEDPPLDPDESVEHGTTPLFVAFKTLLEVEKSLKSMESQIAKGSKAIKRAIELNEEFREDLERVVHTLVVKGADCDLVESGGDHSPSWHLLHYCASFNAGRRASMLLKHGCAADVQDDHGRTPLHEAAKKNSLSVLDCLLRCGARVDSRDSAGNSPLMLAAAEGLTTACRALLLAGANKDALNRDLKSPSDLAHEKKHYRALHAISSFFIGKVSLQRLLGEIESDYKKEKKKK